MRIWDLRRGDDDDNCTSPHGRGLRSLVFSAALEFNYLKAPIGFIALIVAPALLIGIAPSVVIDYGRLMFHASHLAGYSPLVGLAFFLALAGAAFWIGRPLAAMAFDNFWHLHYSLVLPVLVALRELLRSLAERFGRRPVTPERLARGRKICGVAAALLVVAGGLALAAIVEISLGLQLVDILHVRFWTVTRAALGNAAVVLGLSAAVESLYWIWREFSLDSLARDWMPSLPGAGASLIRVAHLSDLHVVGERYGYRMEAGTDGPRGNRCIRSALRKLATIHASTPLDRVLMTGDITDAGTRAEWAAFIDLLRGCPELRRRLSLVPGNHDVNIIDRTNPGRLDLPWSAGQSLRKLRVVLALDAFGGDRAHIVDHGSGALGPTLGDYLRQGKRTELLRALAERGSTRGRREMARVWEAIFPLVEPPGPDDEYGLILLNSNARSHFSLTNAIGVVSPPQIKALKLVLQSTSSRPWLILLHHQIVEYPVASVSLRERIGLALINAPDLVAALAPHARRVIVLHGHRHRDWVGVCGNIVLCSAPSTSLGGGGDKYRGSFHVHQLSVEAGGVRLTATERISVS